MSRILIVEDYPMLAKVIAIAVHREGWLAERVGSVQRALDSEGTFDIAIVDVDLPDGNGIDLARQLREAGRVRGVAFYTSSRDSALLAEAAQQGPVLDKSASVDALMELVGQLLTATAQMARAVGSPDAALVGATGRSGTRRRMR